MNAPLLDLAGPERVRQTAPFVAQIRAAGQALKLPVGAHERTEIGLGTRLPPLAEHTQVPRIRVDPELRGENERAIPKRIGGRLQTGHAEAIGIVRRPVEALPPNGGPRRQPAQAADSSASRITENAAPSGSSSTAMRPYGVSVGSRRTRPPSSAAVVAIASGSSTAK